MIDLDDLRAFQKVGALLSFSAAAKCLAVRKSAVSRSVQRLEDLLQVQLLERTTRSVSLTDAGATLLNEIGDLAERLDRIVELAGELNGRPRGRLRITAGIGFGLEVLTELVPEFAEVYPEISVSLDLTSRVVDLVGEQVDLAFRMGALEDSSLVATRLGAIKCSLCASPAYLARRGMPTSPEDLARHDVLAMPRPDGLPRKLALRHADGAERLVEANARVTANDLHAICQMVVKGAGISAMADFATKAAVEGDQLVVVLPQWRPVALDMSIVMPSGRARSPAVRAFIDFVRRRMADQRDWFAK